MRIKHNVSALNSLRHANNTYNEVKGSLKKLSSGQKINSGADGPADLIASERIRGRIAGLKQAYDNAETSVSIIQTAEGALNEISSILLRLKQLAVHAANEATNDRAMLAADQLEIEHLLSSVDRIATNTVWGSKKLLDGSMGVNGVAIGEHLRFVEATSETPVSPEDGFSINITQVATQATKVADTSISVNNIADGLFLVISEGGKNATLDMKTGKNREEIDAILENVQENPTRFPPKKANKDLQKIVTKRLQKSMDEAGLQLHTFIDPRGRLVVRHNEFGDHTIFSVTSSVPGILSEKANIAEFSEPGKNVAGYIAEEVALGKGQFLTALEGTRAGGLTVAFERQIGLKEVPVLDERGVEVGTQYIAESNEEIVGKDVEGYVHLEQHSQEFRLGPDPAHSAKFSLQNVKAHMMSQGIENKSGFRNLSEINVTNLQGAKDTIRLVNHAITETSTLRANLGAFQKNALESNLNSLKIAEENLSSAESMIRDADMAEEMSRLTSDQILLSASTAMVAQANQMPKTVLGLIESGGAL